ncbi:MAG: trypsin-like peptidase domain-containing protein [Sulfurospirillaceae bacterium]|nr:trypsin-like peptidase domain-containing protein [Sulfurospirillaceae bacterium]
MRKILSVLLICIFSVNVIAQDSFTTLVSKTEKTVVLIKTYDENGDIIKIGSGFFIDNKGVLVSNYHVFEDCVTASITTSNNSEFVVDEILVSSRKDDIIKFSIANPENISFNSVTIASTKPLKGDDIFVIGNPKGLSNSVSKGIISSVRNVPDYENMYQITAPISAGSSGSPVFNMNGELFGIATFQLIEGQNLNFAIDISILNKIQNNDIILSSFQVKKELPKDKNKALEILDLIEKDSSIILTHTPKELIYYYNQFISYFPNDYIGYYKRAVFKFKNMSDFSSFTYDLDKWEKERSQLYADVIADYTTALKLKTNDSKIKYKRAYAKMSYLFEKNSNKIENCSYEDVLSELSSTKFSENSIWNALKYYNQAFCYEQLKQYKFAIVHYSNAISLMEKTPDNEIDKLIKEEAYSNSTSEIRHYHIQQSLYKRGLLKVNASADTVGGLADIDQSISLNEKYRKKSDLINYSHYRKRADLRYDLKNFSGALQDYQIVNSNENSNISNDSKNCYSFLIESSLLQDLNGDLNDALKASVKSIELLNGRYENSDSYYFYNRARIYYKLQKYSNALFDINKAIELDNDNTSTDYLYLRIYVKTELSDHFGALADINKIIPKNFNDDYAHYTKGMILWRLDDNIGAENSITKAIELNPKESIYYMKRGSIKYNQNKTSACADWSKAGELGEYKAYDYIRDYCK